MKLQLTHEEYLDFFLSHLQDDNIFPIEEFPHRDNKYQSYYIGNFNHDLRIKNIVFGDVIEFGVGTTNSIIKLASSNPDRKFFGIDHFRGLEKTNNYLPENSDWKEGLFMLGDKNIPDMPNSMDEVYERLKPYPNINLIAKDINKLEDPSYYGIEKVVAVNMDTTLYEPTREALTFIDKCNWEKIQIRFNSWRGHESGYDAHQRLAAREWLFENAYTFALGANGVSGALTVWKNPIPEEDYEYEVDSSVLTKHSPKLGIEYTDINVLNVTVKAVHDENPYDNFSIKYSPGYNFNLKTL